MISLARGVLCAGLAAAMVAAGTAQSAPPPTQTPPPAQTPLPKPVPFPGAGAPAQTKPTNPTPPANAVVPKPGAPQDGAALDPRLSGVAIYPGAELLESFDGGSNQRVFLFGSSLPYADVVAFYKTQLRNGGNEVFRTPAMHQFDLGSFRSETMVYRPSVVVKDYGGAETAGYLHVSGTTEKRYRTVIQIVPVTK